MKSLNLNPTTGAYTHIASLVNWALRTKLTPAPVVEVNTEAQPDAEQSE